MTKYEGDFRSDFRTEIEDKVVPYILDQFPWRGMEAYMYAEPADEHNKDPELVYGIRQKGAFGEIDLDPDITVYTFDLEVNPDWLNAEYDWDNLSDSDKKSVIAEFINECY